MDNKRENSTRLNNDLQVELVAGVTSVEFGAGESELPLAQRSRLPVPVSHLSHCLLVVSHGVHTLSVHARLKITLTLPATCSSKGIYCIVSKAACVCWLGPHCGHSHHILICQRWSWWHPGVFPAKHCDESLDSLSQDPVPLQLPGCHSSPDYASAPSHQVCGLRFTVTQI